MMTSEFLALKKRVDDLEAQLKEQGDTQEELKAVRAQLHVTADYWGIVQRRLDKLSKTIEETPGLPAARLLEVLTGLAVQVREIRGQFVRLFDGAALPMEKPLVQRLVEGVEELAKTQRLRLQLEQLRLGGEVGALGPGEVRAQAATLAGGAAEGEGTT